MRQKLWLLLILALAAYFRLQNINWDAGHFLHPDERFLAMVASAMRQPSSFGEYIDPGTSSFNPANLGFKFFVYGVFPLVAAKLLAIATQLDSFLSFLYVGRVLSAAADLLVVILLFKALRLLEIRYTWGSKIKYYGALLYAISVLPIALSHFFAVDTFLNVFMFASFYFALKFHVQKSKSLAFVVLSAIFFGLAIGSKITAVFILPLNLFFILFTTSSRSYKGGDLFTAVKKLLLYILIAYVTLRVADPYLFESVKLLDPTPSQLFLANLKELKALSGPEIWFPPGIQWLSKTPILFSLQNLALWGLGPFQFALLLIGVYVAVRKKLLELLVIFLWVAGFFIYQSSQFAQTMRYFLPLYPFFAIFGALGLNYLARTRVIRYTLYVLLLLWPLAFTSIYLRPHSRVVASHWVYENIGQGSVILSEHWDDALPLHFDGETKQFTIKELPVFGQDTPQKWSEMEALFREGDYYILSSNRAWGSIMAVPGKYPRQAKFYKDLFAGRTRWHKVAEFTSYPQLCLLKCLTIDDSSADESFTVYDHPKVMIFKKALK